MRHRHAPRSRRTIDGALAVPTPPRRTPGRARPLRRTRTAVGRRRRGVLSDRTRPPAPLAHRPVRAVGVLREGTPGSGQPCLILVNRRPAAPTNPAAPPGSSILNAAPSAISVHVDAQGSQRHARGVHGASRSADAARSQQGRGAQRPVTRRRPPTGPPRRSSSSASSAPSPTPAALRRPCVIPDARPASATRQPRAARYAASMT